MKNDELNTVTLLLTDDELKSLDTFAWQEEGRLDLRQVNGKFDQGGRIRAAVVAKIQAATARVSD